MYIVTRSDSGHSIAVVVRLRGQCYETGTITLFPNEYRTYTLVHTRHEDAETRTRVL